MNKVNWSHLKHVWSNLCAWPVWHGVHGVAWSMTVFETDHVVFHCNLKQIKALPYASIQKDWVLRHLAMWRLWRCFQPQHPCGSCGMWYQSVKELELDGIGWNWFTLLPKTYPRDPKTSSLISCAIEGNNMGTAQKTTSTMWILCGLLMLLFTLLVAICCTRF